MMEIKIGYVVYFWVVLNGIKIVYFDLYDWLVRKMEDGIMIWLFFCQEYSVKVVMEEIMLVYFKIIIEIIKVLVVIIFLFVILLILMKKCD